MIGYAASWRGNPAESSVLKQKDSKETEAKQVNEPPEAPGDEAQRDAHEGAKKRGFFSRLKQRRHGAESDQPPGEDSDSSPLKPEKQRHLQRLRSRLARTRSNMLDGLADFFELKRVIDEEVLEELETRLLMADIGVDATAAITRKLTKLVARKELKDVDALLGALRTEMLDMLEPVSTQLVPDPGKKPFVILMVGVNGVGKTTTIGKLARRYMTDGHSVLLAAGDTFRAAAVEQLQAWGTQNGVPVIAQEKGADSASVIYDAIQAGQARGIDIVIADTAGRLHTQSNLMEELKKVHRVMAKLDPSAPHEVMLVVDATTGQNALAQATQFDQAVPLTGITLTKLDGTAKGGILFAIAKRLKIPLRYIGVGESAEDLRVFDAREFVEALVDLNTERAA